MGRVKFLRAKRGSTSDISPALLDQIRRWRHEVRMDEIGYDRPDAGQCGLVSEVLQVKLGWGMDAGFYLEHGPDTLHAHQDHVWNVLPDGRIFDATHDQFGAPDILIAAAGDPRYHAWCGSYDCPHCTCAVCNPDFAMEAAKHKRANLLTKCAAPSWDTLYTALARSFPTAEAFSKAYSLGGARPRAWHLSSSERFSVDPAHHPEDGGMGGSGGRTPEPSLFVTTDPAYWGPRGSGYLSGRAYVFEIDLTGLTFGADYHADARGVEGLVLSASGMQKARNLGAIPLASALRRAKAQQAAGPQSREELDALFARAHSVKQAAEKIEDGTYSMPLDEAIDEHVKLVDVLKSPSHTDDLEEAKEQGKELKEMQEAKKTSASHLLYHGGRPGLTKLEPSRSGSLRGTICLTDSLKVAASFGREIYTIRVDSLPNPLVVDAQGAYYSEVPTPECMLRDGFTYRDCVEVDLIADYARKTGHGCAVVKNVAEGFGGGGLGLSGQMGTTYLMFDPNGLEIVSSDAYRFDTYHGLVKVKKTSKLLQPKIAATLRVKPNDIGLMTLDEYLKHQNAGGTHHPDESYDWPVEKMNQDYSKHWIGYDPSNRYSAHKHRGGYTINSVVDQDLVGVSDGKTLWIRYPLTSLPNDYWINGQRTLADFGEVTQVKYPAEYLTRVFDPTKHSLEKYPVLLQTLHDYQVRAADDPTKKQGTSLAVIHKGMIVAQAQDEWGATLIAVAQEYRGHGLGSLIARYWAMYNPDYTSGGFTSAGQQTAIKSWSNRVRELLSHGVYSEMVAKGEITQERVAAITEKLRSRDKGISTPGQVGTPDTGKMLVYTDDIQFVLYDSAFLQDQDESHIKGFGFMRDSSHAGVFFYTLEYDPKFKEVATAVALQMAKDQGTPLYMGKGYRDHMDVGGFPIRVEGDNVSLTHDVINLHQLTHRERTLRRQADPHQEMEYTLIEAAHQKNWGGLAKASSVTFKRAAQGITLVDAQDVADLMDECFHRIRMDAAVAVELSLEFANGKRSSIIISPDPTGDEDYLTFTEGSNGKIRSNRYRKDVVSGAAVAKNVDKAHGAAAYPVTAGFKVQALAALPPKLTAQQIASGGLKKLSTIKDTLKRLWALHTWAAKHYPILGSGSSRAAFKLDKDHALKIALNAAGVAQNLTESHIAQKLHDLPITQVHHVDLDGAAMVVDFAHELDEKHFERDYGVSFDEFAGAITDNHHDGTPLSVLPPKARKLLESAQSHGLSLMDLRYPAQWGDLKSHPVLLDYGLTHDVWREHYKRSKFLRPKVASNPIPVPTPMVVTLLARVCNQLRSDARRLGPDAWGEHQRDPNCSWVISFKDLFTHYLPDMASKASFGTFNLRLHVDYEASHPKQRAYAVTADSEAFSMGITLTTSRIPYHEALHPGPQFLRTARGHISHELAHLMEACYQGHADYWRNAIKAPGADRDRIDDNYESKAVSAELCDLFRTELI